MTPEVIDAHTHLWDMAQVRLSWFRPELGLPERAVVEALEDAARPTPVTGALAVQAADTVEEALWLAHHVRGHALLRGLVLQYEPRPGLWGGASQELLTGAGPVVGVRVATPSGATDLSDVPGLTALAEGLTRAGLVMELLVRPEQLPAVAELSAAHPGLRVVVCHLGLGNRPADATWRAGLAELSQAPGVAAKVSGLAPETRAAEELTSLVGAAFEAFGPGRLLFGSDWPMSVRSLTYEDVLARTAAALPPLTSWAAAQFWGGTARRIYRI
ncbi:amidohydrolase family protein [Tessaracoccus terricola]